VKEYQKILADYHQKVSISLCETVCTSCIVIIVSTVIFKDYDCLTEVLYGMKNVGEDLLLTYTSVCQQLHELIHALLSV
jgi:hypothetical protein